MRLGDVMWKQVIELRSRNHASPRDDERLEALFRWVLPYYYGWNTRHTHSPDLSFRPANKQGRSRPSALAPSPMSPATEQRFN